ncbi:hypothetical protein BGX21_000299 [Mortierella sp. AD011]|nr:hypothetical protein BGX20_010790 [Mortierella sp. AD010]KAF9388482.1 hypothetical protein BGX21_000299 [Mortierella sp. AD011]
MQHHDAPPPYTRHGSTGPSQTSPDSPLSTHAQRTASNASISSTKSTILALPDDYNPLQYPPPSRVRAGTTEVADDTDDEFENPITHSSHSQSPSVVQGQEQDQHQEEDDDYMIGGYVASTKPHKQNIQGISHAKKPISPGDTRTAKVYKLRLPIQPKEVVKGVRLAVKGCYIALTNPGFKNGHLYKTLIRLLVFTLIAHVVTQILFFLPVAMIGSLLRLLSFSMDADTTESQRGLETFSNKVHELTSTIPLIGLLFMRYIYPQPLDDIFVEALSYSDQLLAQEHRIAKEEQARHPTEVDPNSPSIYVMDHRGPFTPALLAYPYHVRHWQDMWRYMRRFWSRMKWGVLFLVLSWIPVIGRFAFPIASFLSTIQSIGSKPLAIVFAVTSFLLPRSVSIYLLKGFFGCRALTRELLDPYFIRVGMTHYQKRKWFNYRKSVLLGFGVVFYVGCSFPLLGVVIFGLAQASAAYVLQSLADPPPPPVLKPKSSSKTTRAKKE